MDNLKKVYNTITGNEELVGLVTLQQAVNLEPKDTAWQTYTNSKGETKRYLLTGATVGAGNFNVTCQIPEGNILKMKESGQSFEIGAQYLATIAKVPSTKEEGKFVALGRMSHLRNLPTQHDEIVNMFESLELSGETGNDVIGSPATRQEEITTEP